MRALEVNRVLFDGDGDSTRVLLVDRVLRVGSALLLDRRLSDGESARVRLDDLSLVRRPESDGGWSRTSLPKSPREMGLSEPFVRGEGFAREREEDARDDV